MVPAAYLACTVYALPDHLQDGPRDDVRGHRTAAAAQGHSAHVVDGRACSNHQDNVRRTTGHEQTHQYTCWQLMEPSQTYTCQF